MAELAWVGAGGLLGSLLRTLLSLAVGTSSGFPIATFAVNLIGSGLLGWFIGSREGKMDSSALVGFVAVGVLGSLTTFSAFSYEVFSLVDARQFGLALAYVALSLIGGLAAVLGGHRLSAR